MIRIALSAGVLTVLLSGCAATAVPEATPSASQPATTAAPTVSSSPSTTSTPSSEPVERAAVLLPAPLDVRLPGTLIGEVGQERGNTTRAWYAAIAVPSGTLTDLFALTATQLRAQGFTVTQTSETLSGTRPIAPLDGVSPSAAASTGASAEDDRQVRNDAWVYITPLEGQFPEAFQKGYQYVAVSVVETLPTA